MSNWFRVRNGHVLHWPEYGPGDAGVVSYVKPLVGRQDRVWALADQYVRIDHKFLKWCVEGQNGQRHKLLQVKAPEIPKKGSTAWLKRVRVDLPPPVVRAIREIDAEDQKVPDPPKKRAKPDPEESELPGIDTADKVEDAVESE